MSSALEIKTGTPQGSRLSPLLFICLMADMNLWIKNSMLSNFADDTQSLVISDSKEEALEVTLKEANSVVSFFGCNNLVNNVNKAAILYNCKGKGSQITVENIGSETISSSYSEKLLGLYLNSDFVWSTQIDKLSIELKKRIGLLKRIKNRVPKSKIVTIAEAIFNSKIRYGIAVYLNPIFDEEDLKMKKLSKHAHLLQTLQNTMIRIILGINKKCHTNMQEVREKNKMMSVNQMCIYHILIEAYNVIRNSSSKQNKIKWSNKQENKYSLRSETNHDQKIPEKPIPKCTGFSYTGAKLFNKLPCDMKESTNSNTFKLLAKAWIWRNIPAY